MPRPGHPPSPYIAPLIGDMDQRLASIAQAISKKADNTSIPTYAALHLIAPDGGVWMLSVASDGALVVEQMP